MNALVVLMYEIRRFFKTFSENLINFFSSKIAIANSVVGGYRVLSGLRIFPIYGCSNHCSFPDMTFFVIFLKFFRKPFFFKICYSLPEVGGYRVLSGIANFAFEYDCSIFCNFRDVTFFVIFFKSFSENLFFFKI